MLGRVDLVKLTFKHGTVPLQESHQSLPQGRILEVPKVDMLPPVLLDLLLLPGVALLSSGRPWHVINGPWVIFFRQRLVLILFLVLCFFFVLFSWSRSCN